MTSSIGCARMRMRAPAALPVWDCPHIIQRPSTKKPGYHHSCLNDASCLQRPLRAISSWNPSPAREKPPQRYGGVPGRGSQTEAGTFYPVMGPGSRLELSVFSPLQALCSGHPRAGTGRTGNKPRRRGKSIPPWYTSSIHPVPQLCLPLAHQPWDLEGARWV